MALPIVYRLADREGTLHVTARSADWSRPQYVVNWFPTNRSTREFCRFFEITPEQLPETFTLRCTLPGCYEITDIKGMRFMPSAKFPEITLTEGGRTKSVAVTFEPVPVPKVGKKTRREWDGGRWRIVPPNGKPRTVEV